jgi:hypothetical protein
MNQIVHLTSKLTIAQGDLEAIRRTAPETLSHANCATCAAAKQADRAERRRTSDQPQ